MYRLGSKIACSLIISGCAAGPNSTVNYYLAQTEIKVRVVRTVTCNEKDELIVANEATPTVRHFAELSEKPKSFDISKLNGSLANTNITFEFYDDNRLMAVNAKSAGQGEAVVKSASGFASMLPLFLPTTEACDFINGYAKKNGKSVRDKAMAIAFEGIVDLTEGKETKIKVIPQDAGRYNKLKAYLGGVFTKIDEVKRPDPPLSRNDAKSGGVLLEMRQPARVGFTVSVGDNRDLVWKGDVPVAHLGKTYYIPIPKAALFGNQGFELAVSPAGAVTKLGYNKDTGAGQILSAGALITDELRDTTAEKAAKVKAEADLIAQQQRLVRCLANPTECK